MENSGQAGSNLIKGSFLLLRVPAAVEFLPLSSIGPLFTTENSPNFTILFIMEGTLF